MEYLSKSALEDLGAAMFLLLPKFAFGTNKRRNVDVSRLDVIRSSVILHGGQKPLLSFPPTPSFTARRSKHHETMP